MPPEPPFTAIVLAARRDGTIDPLAAEASVSNKCLVPIAGVALIRHVVDALLATPGLARLRIVVEPDTVPLIRALLPAAGPAIEFVEAADNLADSVHAAAKGVAQPMVVTTADNVLLTPDAVEDVLRTMRDGADVVVAFARQAAVLAAHRDGQRRFYRFADDAYSNCNLYAFGGPRAIAAAESFRGGGQFAKKPLRLVVAAGLVNVALLLLKRLSLEGAFTRLSRRFGLQVRPVILADGACAIDVDNRRTYDVALELLARRGTAPRLVATSGNRANA